MFPKLNEELIAKFSQDPTEFLTMLHEFKNASFVAAKDIADNNVAAFMEMTQARDPNEFAKLQNAIVQSTIEKNVNVMVNLWKTFGIKMP